ncbi:uncharacterized protein E0L32_007417 [Thyridium curvatum]|uniref:GPI anchored protein n=1 Tax=Thyridium curvatum TaxID=1093900 RepID=A0A507B3M4_9PEZI|nr:uncharacterized protein E0L32_007417 [Thyridium curvatum]TPX11919.1 hypothetical protein E0L32_007417 [Thyridium curvatum]
MRRDLLAPFILGSLRLAAAQDDSPKGYSYPETITASYSAPWALTTPETLTLSTSPPLQTSILSLTTSIVSTVECNGNGECSTKSPLPTSSLTVLLTPASSSLGQATTGAATPSTASTLTILPTSVASTIDVTVTLSTCPPSTTCSGQTMTWTGGAGPTSCPDSQTCSAVLPTTSMDGNSTSEEPAPTSTNAAAVKGTDVAGMVMAAMAVLGVVV